MPSKSAGTKKLSRRMNLHVGASFLAAWEHVLLPWFRSVARCALESDRLPLVVLPYSSRTQFFRGLLITTKVPLLGVNFVTPAQLRDMLVDTTQTNLPLREHLRLLLAIAAEEEIAHRQTENAETIAAKSVRRAPHHLLHTIDELAAAGWSFAEAGPPSFRPVVERFEKLVSAGGFTLVQHADFATLERSRSAEKIFGDLLIAGFDGAHWPLWPLLAAAAHSAQRVTIVLADPRDEARDLDECWIGTWEQTFGAANPIDAASVPAPSIRASPDSPQLELFADKPARTVHFLLGQETTEEARTVVALVLNFLADQKSGRIGVLFPATGALTRTVATLLEQQNIPHFDGVGHPVAPTLEDLSWLAWLQLQENNRTRPLLEFFATLDERAQVFGELSRIRIEDVLRRALGQILIDDLSVLCEYCAKHCDAQDAPMVAACVADIKILPRVATLSEFIAQTIETLKQFRWEDRRIELERLSAGWSESMNSKLSRESYLRWLGEILGKPRKARNPLGDHPYSRVHLLLLAEAEGQSWSHLILAGQNEGAWPPSNYESDFVRDAEIDALNRKIRILNRGAVVQGRYGEGQWSVQEGKTLCLGTSERRAIALRQMANLMESADTAVAVTASLFTESAPRRIANPSEFFTRLYFDLNGRALSQAALEAMEEQTRSWLEKTGWRETEQVDGSVRQTRLAYDARRREAKAGEFEFALREPLDEPISFSASEAERLFKCPALIWMKRLLGVEADDEEFEPWSLAIGNWVHNWLRHIVDCTTPESFGELGPNLLKRVETSSLQFREDIAALLKKSGRPVPDWWNSTWSNAAYLANYFANQVALTHGWSCAGTEWSLRNLPPISTSRDEGLKLRGRIDLILAREAPVSNRFDEIPLWVIDYKTGKRKSLCSSKWDTAEKFRTGVRKQLAKGEGIQVSLYALALRQLGAADVSISLLARNLDLGEPQLSLDAVAAHPQIWNELGRMQRTGVFGMRGFIRSEYDFTAPYPLATLAIDYDLLEAKWALTHPAFTVPDTAEDE